MPSKPAATRLFPALSAALIVGACSTPGSPLTAYPPAADLAVPPKPQPTVEILTSAQASAAYNSAVEAWGDGLAAQVARLCRWAEGMGAKDLACPPPDR